MEEGAPVPVPIGGSDGADGGGEDGASLIRQLASCNKTTRDRALKLVIGTWLPSQRPGQISDDNMKKLWKGLFYCVWHADKTPVQADLTNRLSSLLLALDLPLSLDYLSVFFVTMRREWTGIDFLRLDKFYLLIRRFLHCSFLMLKQNYSWDLEICCRLMGILEEKTIFADDKYLGHGVNYHIASVFLEELRNFLPIRSEILDVIFKPFLSVMYKSQDKVLLAKVKSNMFDVLLKMGRNLLEDKKLGANHLPPPAASDIGDREAVSLGTIALTMGFSAKFYDLGTSPDCIQGNRKVLFSLHEDFLKLEKEFAASGIEILNPDSMVDNGEDEVPKFIPIATETEGTVSDVVLESNEVAIEGENAADSKPSKKNKKAKKGSEGSRDKEKALNGDNKKASKKKRKKGDAIIANGETTSGNGTTSDETSLIFSESVISNLQIQFEKVAAEGALDEDSPSSFDSPEITVRTHVLRKRKRARSMDGKDPHNLDLNGGEEDGCDSAMAAAKSLEKSSKKVKFSMKNNLVWKPHSPLPPQSLRLPPSVTPRGSALKKGIPPGPIREIPTVTKKAKQKKKKMMGRKGVKTISPAIKRLRKLQTLSV
ncbi:hypothetical protein U1Q18_041171 [Sarracenia purpurea var. burkii]